MVRDDKIYSATYSNVPVYELNRGVEHVMRRRSDDWINATHILKVADFDKPARTRILEREVQKGIHEKVQGGYGKYQGTWIPLPDGRSLAERNGVLETLLPLLDFVPGDRSPPPAPKHATAASGKPRVPRQSNAAAARSRPKPPGKAAKKPVARTSVLTNAAAYHPNQDYHPNDIHIQDAATPDDATVISESQADDFDAQYTNQSRNKRRRMEDTMSQADKDHMLWADELLDYFMLQDNPVDGPVMAPIPPAHANIDRPIDDKGHTALHWAAAMGDLEVVRDLLKRGADINAKARNGETPLMRAVMFTNNFDRQCMDRMLRNFLPSVGERDNFASTVLHSVANTTLQKSKYACARYYTDSILNAMASELSTEQFEAVINTQDGSGDTAVTIAARNGARKCVRSLLGRNAAVDIPNHDGVIAEDLILLLNQRRHDGRHTRMLSSSPFQADHVIGGAVQPLNGHIINPILFDGLASQHSLLHSTSNPTFDTYNSTAAQSLTTQVLPLFASKSHTLAATLDASIAEKDAELAEAERVASQRRAELAAMKNEADALRAQQISDEESDFLAHDLESMERECEAILEHEQARELRSLLAAEEASIQRQGLLSPVTDSSKDQVQLMREKVLLLREFDKLRLQRRELIRAVGRAMSLAGMGARRVEYKRLIEGALGIREDEVEGMLPDILAELEEWRGLEMGGAVA